MDRKQGRWGTSILRGRQVVNDCQTEDAKVHPCMNLTNRFRPIKPPSLLDFRTESFFGGAHSLQWDGSRLWSFRSDKQTSDFPEGIWETLLPPEEADWTSLWRILDEANAWGWPRLSTDPMVMDGETWTLKLHWGRHRWSGLGYEARPQGFDAVAQWLDKLMATPPIPGIPGPFHAGDSRGGQAWGFRWNGRELVWASLPGPGLSEQSGTLSDLSSEHWSGFMEVCRVSKHLDMTFKDGRFAGISMKASLPGVPVLDEDENPLTSSFFDPIATLHALKIMVMEHHPHP